MKIAIENDHGTVRYFGVETIGMNSAVIEILYRNGCYESIAREQNTKIITY